MTLCSMTGFGAATLSDETLTVSVELKSVNNRYFKLAIRVSEGFTALEPKVETLVRDSVERGTVNASIRIRRRRQSGEFQLDLSVLQSYFEQLLDLDASLGLAGETQHPRLDLLAALPGAVIEADRDLSELDHQRVWNVLEQATRQALDKMQEMRRTEGDSMARELRRNVQNLRDLLAGVERLAPNVASQYRLRLTERIEKIMSENNLTLDPADLVREIALFADRCDVSEEIVRFRSHLEQFETTLDDKRSCGKKLDFLTQELYRETNTIGSKANDAEITRHVVEMKTEIERIREMVQNVE